MTRKTKKKKLTQNSIPEKTLGASTMRGVLSIIFFALTIFFTLAAFDKAGPVGSVVHSAAYALLGFGYVILPLLILLLAVSFLRESRTSFAIPTTVGAFLFLVSCLGIIDLFKEKAGGIIGGFVSKPVVALFDVTVSFIFLIALVIVSLLIIFDTKPKFSSLSFLRKLSLFKNKRSEHKEELPYNDKDDADDADENSIIEDTSNKNEETETVVADDIETKKESPSLVKNLFKKKEDSSGDSSYEIDPSAKYYEGIPFSPPPLSILNGNKGKPSSGDVKANLNIIKRTLKNFNVEVEMDEVSIGPSVTRYALKPAEGVRLTKIVGLQNDLSLALAAHPIRIEAPIPGKSLVGVEVPNATRMTVGLHSLLDSDIYKNSKKPLLISMGRSVSKTLIFADLAKMPHLLIAGATGSGKSVMIHAVIISLLFRNPPENLRFIMIDPKRVELTLYNNIPHLLKQVITEPKDAILSLNWAAKEMARRYEILENEQVQNISSYHENIIEPALKEYRKAKKEGKEVNADDLPKQMPYIVIIIDELSHIMTSYPRELESAIAKLTQMSRAVGIHVILSTQRPSVNVITGLIKANIPYRIAFQVVSQIDSRTILDIGGAEKLLGAGDMLHLSGEMAKPNRLQSAFVSEKEVKKVVEYIVRQHQNKDTNNKQDEYENIDFSQPDGKSTLFETEIDGSNDDDLYEEAREMVINDGKAAVTYLQRKLGIGYARAAKIVDMLEERGVVGPLNGARGREVLEKPSEYKHEDN